MAEISLHARVFLTADPTVALVRAVALELQPPRSHPDETRTSPLIWTFKSFVLVMSRANGATSTQHRFWSDSSTGEKVPYVNCDATAGRVVKHRLPGCSSSSGAGGADDGFYGL